MRAATTDMAPAVHDFLASFNDQEAITRQRIALALAHRSVLSVANGGTIPDAARHPIHGLLVALMSAAITDEVIGEKDVTEPDVELCNILHKLHIARCDAEVRIAFYSRGIDPNALASFLDGVDLAALAAKPSPGLPH